MKSTELLRDVCSRCEPLIEAGAAAPTVPTPCVDWDTGQLVSHIVATVLANTALITETPHQINPFDPEPIAPNLMIGAYLTAVDSLIETINRPGIVDAVIDHPAVEHQITVAEAIMFPTFDTYIHTWDLAQATEQHIDWPGHLTTPISEWCLQTFAAHRPAGIVDNPVEAPADATAIERLVAFLGRDPQPHE